MLPWKFSDDNFSIGEANFDAGELDFSKKAVIAELANEEYISEINKHMEHQLAEQYGGTWAC